MEYVLVPQSAGASRMVYSRLQPSSWQRSRIQCCSYMHHCLETLGVVVMPGPPSIESGSTGDTASGKLKKTAVVAALEVSRDAVAELERKGKSKASLEEEANTGLLCDQGKVDSIARGARGVEYSPTAPKASRAITDEDSLDRIHTTYQDLEKSLRSATLLDSSRSTTAAVDCIPAMTRDVKLTKDLLILQLISEDEDENDEQRNPLVHMYCDVVHGRVIKNESNSAVDTRIDPDPPKRHIFACIVEQSCKEIAEMVGSASKSEVSFAQFDRRQWEGMG
ncbi:hypothetical protein F4604DRAFT_1686083 [Suillus subluteus]|nr:hypothetical protein F4604DRAFT_1686083 [Suillus subluteus]